MRLEELNIQRELSTWEVKRIDRVVMEEKLREFTGHFDVVELHIPYTKYNYLNEIFKEASKKKGKKMLVMCGDNLNLDAFSRYWRRSTNTSMPMEEVEKLIKVLRMAHRVYDHIVYLVTNHEERLNKVIMDNIIDKGVAKEVLKFTRKLTDIFEDEKLGKITYIVNPFIQIGDCIFAHYENNSIVPGKIARDLIQYLTPRINKTWRVCFQAHTHNQLKMAVDRKIIVEIGALIDTLDYWRSGKMHGKGKMSSIGFARGYMTKGIADINKCQFVVCDWEGFL